MTIVVLNPSGLAVAQRLAQALPDHGVIGPLRGQMIPTLQRLFSKGEPLIVVAAAGIVIRALAPLLGDKLTEPPVLALSLDGRVVVPLLGGHHGANRLAETIAHALDGMAAITTAGDSLLGVALDEPPPGWRLDSSPEATKHVMAALLAGAALDVEGDAPWLVGGDAPWLRHGESLSDGGITHDPMAKRRVKVSERLSQTGDLTYRPAVLALGVGCERGTSHAEVADLVRETMTAHDLSPLSLACVASLDLKGDEAAILALAASLGVPLRLFSAARLEQETPRLAQPSEVVFAAVGCHGVAEAAALAAAGGDATLLVSKHRSARATCAVARAPHPIKPPGHLTIVGIGPGQAGWRTPAVSQAVLQADHVVGYGLYLDLLGPAMAGKIRHESALGAESQRARTALDLAAQGGRVALVCSGDAGIYALATLVFELLEQDPNPAWAAIDLVVEPGVSAMQAAAARAGAPLGHDFCAISLSNLLTPWEVIERRLTAAGAGDFVIALYNPVSLRRREQLPAARAILLRCRPSTTPVILARNLGRADEQVEIITLAELDPARVDMLTLVLIGNSTSRLVNHGGRRWVYTPRGYGAGGKLGETS